MFLLDTIFSVNSNLIQLFLIVLLSFVRTIILKKCAISLSSIKIESFIYSAQKYFMFTLRFRLWLTKRTFIHSAIMFFNKEIPSDAHHINLFNKIHQTVGKQIYQHTKSRMGVYRLLWERKDHLDHNVGVNVNA